MGDPIVWIPLVAGWMVLTLQGELLTRRIVVDARTVLGDKMSKHQPWAHLALRFVGSWMVGVAALSPNFRTLLCQEYVRMLIDDPDISASSAEEIALLKLIDYP